MSFSAGVRVAWDHLFAPDHAPESVLRAEAVAAKAPDAVFGTVQAPDEGQPDSHHKVLIDGETEPRVLTSDELVKVVDA